MITQITQSTHPFLRGTALACAAATVFLVATTLKAGDPAEGASKAGEKAASKTGEKISDYRENDSEAAKARVEAGFAQIDAELAHLDALADSAPTEAEKADARTRYKTLRDRRDALKKDYNQARFDAFKADVKQEVSRVSNWAKDTFSNRPAANSAANTADKRVDEASDRIAGYRDNANPATKAEVKASLAQLDADIAQLEQRIENVKDASHQATLKIRLRELKERRAALDREFVQARFDALVADVKTEWNRLIN